MKLRGLRSYGLAESVTVCAFLLAVAYPAVCTHDRNEAKRARVDFVLDQLQHAIDLFAEDNHGHDPERLEVLLAPGSRSRGFLGWAVLPKDPWRTPYAYLPARGGVTRYLASLGADGNPGGVEVDRDSCFRTMRD